MSSGKTDETAATDQGIKYKLPAIEDDYDFDFHITAARYYHWPAPIMADW